MLQPRWEVVNNAITLQSSNPPSYLDVHCPFSLGDFQVIDSKKPCSALQTADFSYILQTVDANR